MDMPPKQAALHEFVKRTKPVVENNLEETKYQIQKARKPQRRRSRQTLLVVTLQILWT